MGFTSIRFCSVTPFNKRSRLISEAEKFELEQEPSSSGAKDFKKPDSVGCKEPSEVGGRIFLTRVNEDLEAIYREIDEELRSQYLLGYYPSDLSGDRWRDLRAEVDVPGATARTIAGYYR